MGREKQTEESSAGLESERHALRSDPKSDGNAAKQSDVLPQGERLSAEVIKQAVRGSAWVHANPWFELKETQVPFGTDHSLFTSSNSTAADYAMIAKHLEKAGINGIQIEASSPRLWDHFKQLLSGIEASGTDLKVIMMVVGARLFDWEDYEKKTDEEKARLIANGLLELLRKNQESFRDHPAYFRIEKRPVLQLSPFGGPAHGGTPRVWELARKILEEEAPFQCVWVISDPYVNSIGLEWFDSPAVDGISFYTTPSRYPEQIQLIEEAGPERLNRLWVEQSINFNHWSEHQGQAQETEPGALFTGLLRQGFADARRLGVDSISITNLTDFVENSAIIPSKERHDSLLRLIANELTVWRGQSPQSESQLPVISTRINVIAGQPMEAEILSLPTSQAQSISLTFVGMNGQPIEEFRDVLKTDESIQVARVSLSPERMAEVVESFLVSPIATLTANDGVKRGYRLPPISLWPTARPFGTYWMTPLAHLLPADWGKTEIVSEASGKQSAREWLPGEQLRYTGPGVPELSINHIPQPQAPFTRRGEAWILKHSDLLPFVTTPAAVITVTVFSGPEEGEAEDSTSFLEDRRRVWYSAPYVWVRDASWTRLVDTSLAVFPDAISAEVIRADDQALGEVKRTRLPKYRFPFYDYQMNADEGEILRDSSGFNHHGMLGGVNRNRWQAVGPFDYTFGHHIDRNKFRLFTAKNRPAVSPVLQTDGSLLFDGKDDSILLPPRSIFPFDQTWEFVLRQHGQSMMRGYLISPWNALFELSIDSKDIPVLTIGGDSVRGNVMPRGETSHLAVVVEGESIRLYQNRQAVGEPLPFRPRIRNERASIVRIGGRFEAPGHQDPLKGTRFFHGEIDRIRISARALSPQDFLNERK